MFSVVGVHYSKVNCVEWSQNTLKLFSGDVDGIVACTEMDYTAVSQYPLSGALGRWAGQ